MWLREIRQLNEVAGEFEEEHQIVAGPCNIVVRSRQRYLFVLFVWFVFVRLLFYFIVYHFFLRKAIFRASQPEPASQDEFLNQ